jgi:hypothetical protein
MKNQLEGKGGGGCGEEEEEEAMKEMKVEECEEEIGGQCSTF